MFDLKVDLRVFAIIIFATLRCLRRHHDRNLSDYVILLSNVHFHRHMPPITIRNNSNAPHVEWEGFVVIM